MNAPNLELLDYNWGYRKLAVANVEIAGLKAKIADLEQQINASTWICGKCDCGPAEHGIVGHPASLCIYEPRMKPAMVQKQAAIIEQLTEALVLLYDKYENGAQCYEDPDECGGFLGHAVRLDGQQEDKILGALESTGIKTALSFTVDGTPKAALGKAGK